MCLQRDDFKRRKLAIRRVDAGEIHQTQIAPKLLVPGNPFIVIEEVPAAIKDETVAVDFDRFGVVR